MRNNTCKETQEKRAMYIDLETFFTLDLKKSGVHKCVESKDAKVLIIAYAFDDGDVKVIDLDNGEEIPREFLEALADKNITKYSFNAAFEIACITKLLGITLDVSKWRCISVLSIMLGFPPSLGEAAKVLNISNGKMESGKDLIKLFSMPCKAAEKNGWSTRNLPQNNKEKWNEFKKYCGRDVEVARDIHKRLKKYYIHPNEQKLWELDYAINTKGVMVDKYLVDNALVCCDVYEDKLKEELYKITGISNCKSVAKLKQWLYSNNIYVEDLKKETVEKLIECTTYPVKRVLEIRQSLSKTSLKKYEAMDNGMCKDGRMRGILQFYGAARTGRWAGRQVQVHNLPRNTMENLNILRELLLDEELYEPSTMELDIARVLSQLIRTAFVPKHGCRFIIADFNSIEARILSWLACEKWRQDVFNTHGKIYEASAAMMFNVPIESVTKGSALRDKGKIAELALGYQGSRGALSAMGAMKMGLSEEELDNLVKAWREQNINIVNLWWQVERCAIMAIKDKVPVYLNHNITFSVENGILFISLPSGRRLAYVNPALELDTRYNKYVITFEGVNQETKKWGKQSTYGGKLTENITQAIARDCLGFAMLNLHENNYDTVMHVHDEVVLEVPHGKGSLEEVERIMATEIPWAKKLTLKAEAFESMYYKK